MKSVTILFNMESPALKLAERKITHEIVINTNVGEKSVELIRDGVTSNAMGYLVQNSSWFKLEAGENIFTYDADSGNSNLQITFTTPVLYSGV